MPIRSITAVCALLIVVVAAVTCTAAGSPELESRISDCSEVVKGMMAAPDGGIPKDLLKRSRAIIIFPSLLKAGLGVGGHYGRGVVLRKDQATGRWGPPAFISIMGGSFGWQVGIQATEMVLLVMSEISLKSLFHDKFTLGADASVAAGPVGRDASAETDIALSAGILSYSRAKGLFAGVSVKGSILEPDWDANEAYYGSDASVGDIFFHGKGTVSPAGDQLIRTLDGYTK